MSEINNCLPQVNKEEVRGRFFIQLSLMKEAFGSEYTKNFVENILLENDNKPYDENAENPYEIRVPDDSVCPNCIGQVYDYCPVCNRV